jgi:quinoprotein glucose dehydrogenase
MARLQFTVLGALICIPFAIAAGTISVRSEAPNAALSVIAKPGEWRYLNSDPQATRYSPLDQINRDNFKDLKIAWRWKPAIGPAPSSLGGTAQSNGDPTLAIYRSEATPIMVGGILYESAGGQRDVAAIDAATGRQLWLWEGIDEGGRDRKAPRRNAGRGVAYWTDPDKSITLKGTVKEFEWNNPHVWIRIMVVDPTTGKPVQYALEMGSVARSTYDGWKRDSVKPGDLLTITMHPLKDGSRGGMYLSAELADGHRFGRTGPAVGLPTARLPGQTGGPN